MVRTGYDALQRLGRLDLARHYPELGVMDVCAGDGSSGARFGGQEFDCVSENLPMRAGPVRHARGSKSSVLSRARYNDCLPLTNAHKRPCVLLFARLQEKGTDRRRWHA